jgi:hypothetical protein
MELVMAGADVGGAFTAAPTMAAAQPQANVLRELPDNWLECQDAQGIFYFNKVTQQSADFPPAGLITNVEVAPVAPTVVQATAPGQPQILRDLGKNWLECLDEQGIFYFNQVTSQSSDTLPPELAVGVNGAVGVSAVVPGAVGFSAVVQGAPIQAKVLSGGIAGAASYAPVAAPSASYAPFAAPSASYSQVSAAPASYTPVPVAPVNYQAIAAAPTLAAPASYTPVAATAPSYTPSYAPVAAAPAPYTQQQYQIVQQPEQVIYQQPSQVVAAPYASVYQQPQAPQQAYSYAQVQPAVAQPSVNIQTVPSQIQPKAPKSAFGDWAVYDDANRGEYFVQMSTGQQFDRPPPQAIQTYQAYKAAGLVVPA